MPMNLLYYSREANDTGHKFDFGNLQILGTTKSKQKTFPRNIKTWLKIKMQ